LGKRTRTRRTKNRATENSFTLLLSFTLANISFTLGRAIHPVRKHWDKPLLFNVTNGTPMWAPHHSPGCFSAKLCIAVKVKLERREKVENSLILFFTLHSL